MHKIFNHPGKFIVFFIAFSWVGLAYGEGSESPEGRPATVDALNKMSLQQSLGLKNLAMRPALTVAPLVKSGGGSNSVKEVLRSGPVEQQAGKGEAMSRERVRITSVSQMPGLAGSGGSGVKSSVIGRLSSGAGGSAGSVLAVPLAPGGRSIAAGDSSSNSFGADLSKKYSNWTREMVEKARETARGLQELK